MTKFFKITAIIAAMLSLQACTRIGTGEVGVRVDAYKQVDGKEHMPGSTPQNLVGDILVFPTKDITIELQNHKPMDADNSQLADFDVTVVYGVNPTSVAELYSTKNKSFHSVEKDGDIRIMGAYMETLIKNASYKIVRKYKSLEIGDKRELMEQEIKDVITQSLIDENLGSSITVSAVQIRNALPNAQILESATNYVKAQNELRIKQTEVDIAKKESERMAALSSNSAQSIAYMQAQAQMKIAEGIASGKVNTIVVPMDFKGMVNIK
jgi:regulator of protease activity HflC (stomatin/prohibitin superfamily)